jgi:hypothetical protein
MCDRWWKKEKKNEQISQQLYVLYGRHRREKESKILERYKNIYQLGKGKKYLT